MDLGRRIPARALTRRELLRAGAAGAAAAALGALPGPGCGPPAQRPNILLVLSDSHRAASTG